MPLTIKEYNQMKSEGRRLGREGLSQRVIALAQQFVSDGPTYKGAMAFAGRMRVICAAAGYDTYWREQIGKGEWAEQREIKSVQRSKTEDAP